MSRYRDRDAHESPTHRFVALALCNTEEQLPKRELHEPKLAYEATLWLAMRPDTATEWLQRLCITQKETK